MLRLAILENHIDQDGFVELFETLEKLNEEAPVELFSTHPNTDKRKQIAKNWQNKLKSNPKQILIRYGSGLKSFIKREKYKIILHFFFFFVKC